MPFFARTKNSEFIPPLLWSSNSPDLDPVDYSVGGILQEKVYKRPVADLDDLKNRIRTEWTKLDVHQWHRHLSACVKAGGGHFGHFFDFDIVFAAITATFLTVIDQSHANRPVWFNCSCQ